MKKIFAISFAILIPIIVAIGAYYGTAITPLLLIGAIATCVILVALDNIKGNLIYFYIFGMSLGLLYQSTMLGVDVVGSDIHSELYFAKLNTIQAWDYNLVRTDNASFAIWFIAPMLSRLLMLDMVWIFKAILPIFLALVPLVLFSVFKRQFGEMRAFFASIFFMIIPVFSMEMASIAKTMVAELFFALMVWVVVSDWKWQYKIIGICLTLIMQVICHYTVGVVAICYLIGMLIIRVVFSRLKWSLFANSKIPILAIAIPIIIGFSAFWIYHSLTAGGWMANHIVRLVLQYLPLPTSTVIDPTVIPAQPSWFTSYDWLSTIVPRVTLVNIAIGLDFMEVPLEGKIFRIIQFLTQLMIIIGLIRLAFFSHLRVTAEFVGFIGVGILSLLAGISLVHFANIINITRYYHYALFFLSPIFVLGCEAVGDAITGNKKVVL